MTLVGGIGLIERRVVRCNEVIRGEYLMMLHAHVSYMFGSG